MLHGTLQDMTSGVVIHQPAGDRVVVGVASPVYPAGSQADRQARLNRQHGSYTLRLILDNGSAMLVHPGNTLFASN